MEINNQKNIYSKTLSAQQSFKGSSMCVTPLINNDRMVDTFIKMTAINTQSKPNAKSFPSTECQKDLANYLYNLLKNDLNLEDVCLHKDNGYVVVATLPGNIESPVSIGLMGHYDTSEDSPGANVQAMIHKNYQGGDITLPADGTSVKASDLIDHIGEDIITSDGSTLLGADDKAGIAEIIEALRVFQENPALKHPTIKVAFTPDEETGEFMPHFNVDNFKVDAAYTLDAKDGHYLDTETFNAINADIEIKGVKTSDTFKPDNRMVITIKGHNMHTGEAKGKLINSINMANALVHKLHSEEAYSDNLIMVEDVEGSASQTVMTITLKDTNANDPVDDTLRSIAKEVLKDYQDNNPAYADQIDVKVEKLKNASSAPVYSVNAIDLAASIMNKIPQALLPENNDGYNGFIHVDDIKGTADKVKMKLLLRDFSMEKLHDKLSLLNESVQQTIKSFKLSHKESFDTVNIEVKDKVLYRNPGEVIQQRPEIIHNAMNGIKKTLKEIGKSHITPEETFIRGGTDGSTLSTMGIPTANLGAGWHNAHAKNEFTTIQKMQECTANIINTMLVWAEK